MERIVFRSNVLTPDALAVFEYESLRYTVAIFG